MVEIDWKSFIEVAPDTLSEGKKDELYEVIAWFKPDLGIDKDKLLHFIFIAQEILRYKNDQVNSLTHALDELAARQGREEGNKLQEYIEEIDRLQLELDYQKKVERSSSRSTNGSNDELKRELMKLEMRNEELLAEFQEKERDLLLERKEVEKYATQVANLEKEKVELSRELKALQDEATEKSSKSWKGSPEIGLVNDQNEIIRQKNKHINQLLEDIEIIEDENTNLKIKLTSVRDELSETAKQMTEITSELSKLNLLNQEYQNKLSESKNTISSLKCQVEELIEEKVKHDKELDEYVVTMNSKLEEWKKILETKDNEIVKLKDEMQNLVTSTSFYGSMVAEESTLNKKILEQQEHIMVLQQELKKATDEINNSTDLIEKLKGKEVHLGNNPSDILSTTVILEQKIKILEEKLIYAEEDAYAKAEEMSELIVQMRDYESKIFGLPEALKKIKTLEKNIQRKNLQIEKLVEICNELEIKLDTYEEQNILLTQKLGFSPLHKVCPSDTTQKFEKDTKVVEKLKFQLDKREEELVKVKLKYHKVIKYLKTFPPNFITNLLKTERLKLGSQNIGNEVDEVNVKLEQIIKENDALRRGMHEVLDSIRTQDVSGTVKVESACLERLLEALDSRHVSGWYHPAMRLQAQLNTEEGKNDELRNQIRLLKVEEKKKTSELQNAYLKIQCLENESWTPRSDKGIETKSLDIIENVKMNDEEKVSSSESEQKIIKLESELHHLRFMYDHKCIDVEKKEKNFLDQKEQLLAIVKKLECQLDLFKNEEKDFDSEKLIELTSEIVVLKREITILKSLEADCRENNDRLREEMIDKQGKMLQTILQLQNEKSELLYKLDDLEKDLEKSISQEKFFKLTEEMENLRSKYQSIIRLTLIKNNTDCCQSLQVEISLFQEEKEELLQKLKTTKEKLIASESLVNDEAVTNADFNSKILSMSSKMADIETSMVKEKQKSNHLEKINNVLKLQIEEFESRNKELVDNFTKLDKENLKLQEIERNLRAKIVSQLDFEDESNLKDKIEKLEKKNRELNFQKENIEELFEISQGQCRAFQECRNQEKILIESLQEQTLLLQSSSDDKATIARLSHELTVLKLSVSHISRINKDLEVNFTKATEQIIGLEVKLSENRYEFLKFKKKNLALIEFLYETISEVREFSSFKNAENILNKKLELYKEMEEVTQKQQELKLKIKEYSVKKEEIDILSETLNDLKKSLKGDNEILVKWHDNIKTLKMNEAKIRRENEFLNGEIVQLQNCIKRLTEEITSLELANIEKDKNWDLKQKMWEESQLNMSQLLQEKGIERVGKTTSNAAINTEIIKDSRVDDSKECLLVEKNLLRESELKVKELNTEVTKLRKLCQEKEDIIKVKETLLNKLNKKSKTIELEEAIHKEKIDCAEKEALKVTINSLQTIIMQKEETIIRYQTLLKEGREEYSRGISKLQEELKNLNETLGMQSRAYNKLKNAMQMNQLTGEKIPAIVEKYLSRIQELEEELQESQMTLTNVNTEAYTIRQELEKWRNLAAERLLLIEETKQRFEIEHNNEIRIYKEKLSVLEKELEELNKVLETHRPDSVTDDTNNCMQQLQAKLVDSDSELHLKSDQLSYRSLQKSSRQSPTQIFRKVEILKRQLKTARDELSRLRDQIVVLQSKSKRSRTAGSVTTRSDSKLPVREGSLTSKIKSLEESLMLSKEREKEIMEINQRKLKSAEEFARWDEKKKSQQTIANLNLKLKEKEAEVEVLKNKNDSFRNMVYKCERDKIILESQLKAVRGAPGGANARIEKLTAEKKQLEVEIMNLQNKFEEQMRHSSDVGVVLLQEKLEAQERKLVSFELASKGQSALIDELERLKCENSALEKANLKLESENLNCNLKLENEKADTQYLINKIERLQETAKEGTKTQVNEEVSFLKKKIEKLTEENKKFQREQKETKNFTTGNKLKKELMMLKEDHKLLKEKYMESVDKNIQIEEELKRCRYQIHLLEEKDLAKAISRTNNSKKTEELSQELAEVKAKLSHKNHLLSRVKPLLIKAAAKERALHEELFYLRNLLPESSTNCKDVKVSLSF